MEITRLSKGGQLIIPKAMREAHHWEAEQEFFIIDMGDGILIKSRKPFQETTLKDVADCLKSQGQAKSLEEIEDEIQRCFVI